MGGLFHCNVVLDPAGPRPARAHIADGNKVLTDWHWRWDVISVLVIFATLYIRGWLRLREIGWRGEALPTGFYAIGLVAIGGALLSPLDDLASYLLIAHMVQHELLMMVAPPFILLANPVPVLLWGLGGNSRLQAGHLLTRHSAIRRATRYIRLDARRLESLCHQPLGLALSGSL